ncbi:MAG: CrcB family protein [Acidimicrobiales bacterium]
MRTHWDRHRVLAIAAGGVVGSATRWAVLATMTTPGTMPWPVLGVNVVGSVLLGVVLAEEWVHPRARLLLHDGAAIGFCGGLTTFSTFTVEIVDLARDGELAVAAAYGALSIVLSIAGVLVGAAGLRQVRAASLPLEEEP